MVVRAALPQICSNLEDRNEKFRVLGPWESHASRMKFPHESRTEGGVETVVLNSLFLYFRDCITSRESPVQINFEKRSIWKSDSTSVKTGVRTRASLWLRT